jgi:diaminohydroxyphosphoribosylaminopyrimidine deaminase/5-amino-6-(5-phosphoribosylamino)uracil reductase
MSWSAADHAFMAQALRLAELGLYTTTPNPRVGCVLVKAGRVIGTGWHRLAGEAHAEVNALADAAHQGEAARGATAYITLEPCSHQGRTGPCVEALIAAGIERVIAAVRDPNPLVAGDGMAKLAAAGVVAESGLLAAEARELNVGFFSRMERGRPWMRTKIAASLDGKTALLNGESQWITGEDARRDGHRLRARSCAMLTGAATVLEDDPQLTVRSVPSSRQPLRVVVDSRLETPPAARVLQGGGTLVFTVSDDDAKARRLREAGAEVMRLPEDNGKIALPSLAAELARRGCNEVTVESGAKLNASLLRAGLIDEIVIYQAPVLLGDAARGLFALPQLSTLAHKIELEIRDLRRIGKDLRIIARPRVVAT